MMIKISDKKDKINKENENVIINQLEKIAEYSGYLSEMIDELNKYELLTKIGDDPKEFKLDIFNNLKSALGTFNEQYDNISHLFYHRMNQNDKIIKK